MAARTLFTILALIAFGACSPRPAKVDNKEGIVTSIGPVIEAEDGLWTIHLSVFDYEGDPVDVHAEIAGGDDPWTALEHCSDAPAPCLKQKLRGLSSRDNGKDAQHVITIDAGGLALSKTTIRMYALEDQEDLVTWPQP